MRHVGALQALPRACSLLGSLLAFILLWLVAAMTWVSISRGIVHPASQLLQIAEQDESPPDADEAAGCGIEEELSPLTLRPPMLVSYSGLVRRYLGGRAAQVFNTFLIANALG